MYAQLIFSLSRYEAVIDAYMDGLEASGLSDLSRVTSVASFFVSRVDTLVDKKLEKIGTPEALDLRGKVTGLQIIFFPAEILDLKGRDFQFRDKLLFSGRCCSSCSGIPAVPEEILWSKMGSSGEKRCQEAEAAVGLNQC